MKKLLVVAVLIFLAGSAFAQHTEVTVEDKQTISGAKAVTNPCTLGGTWYVSNAGCYTTVTSAASAAGSSPIEFEIPANYSGTDCPSLSSTQVWLDYRQFTNSALPCSNKVITIGGTSNGGLFSLFRGINTTNSVTANGNVSIYSQNELLNAMCTGSCTADGGSSELDVGGTFSGTADTFNGAEDDVNVSSTGGTITNANGGIGYLNTQARSTTAITNGIGYHGYGCKTISGSVPVNCYAFFGEEQTAGSSHNYTAGLKGMSVLAYGSNFGGAGLDVQDSSLAYHHLIVCDSSGSQICSIQGGAGGLKLKSSDGVVRFSLAASGTSGNNLPIVASLATTGATSDNVALIGMTSFGHCSLTATNASAATNIATTYVSAKTTNQITVTHTARASMTYDVMCTPN